ncbi:hypothetical protein AVEN_103603-1 [Araneus ventricosus]|uniref:Uncharacterized protein n=1 Tax=Araneus ventricosus TaxID=182803 RepID=A0A4Y2V379_ARAVE|nr:hypothetical protein AVEN_103603-1 [Araneus ventricosus]
MEDLTRIPFQVAVGVSANTTCKESSRHNTPWMPVKSVAKSTQQYGRFNKDSISKKQGWDASQHNMHESHPVTTPMDTTSLQQNQTNNMEDLTSDSILQVAKLDVSQIQHA